MNTAFFSYLWMSPGVGSLFLGISAPASPEGVVPSCLSPEEFHSHRRNQVEGMTHHLCQLAEFLSQLNQEAHKKTLSLGNPCLPSFHPPGAWERTTKGCGEQWPSVKLSLHQGRHGNPRCQASSPGLVPRWSGVLLVDQTALVVIYTPWLLALPTFFLKCLNSSKMV